MIPPLSRHFRRLEAICRVDVSHLKVVAGDWDYDSTVEPLPPIQRLVKAKLVHDDYDDATLAHDVAVLLLNQPLPASVTVDIVCLPQQNSYSFLNNRCLSTGWGKDEYSKWKRSYQLEITKNLHILFLKKEKKITILT